MDQRCTQYPKASCGVSWENPCLCYSGNPDGVADASVLTAALPTLDINEGALDKIFAIYKKMLPTSGYLTHAGQLHADRLEALLQHLALLEQETLEQRAAVSFVSLPPFLMSGPHSIS